MSQRKSRLARAFGAAYEYAVGTPRKSRGRRSRLRLESLEDRMLPTVFNVLGTGDPTPLAPAATFQPIMNVPSLRQAIIDANADPSTGTDKIILPLATINLFLGNTSGHEMAAQQGDLNITSTKHALLIQGQFKGKDQTVIDASKMASSDPSATRDRLFEVAPGVSVTFQHVTLTGGLALDDGTPGAAPGTTDALGGAILSNGGDVKLDHVTIKGNMAAGASGISGSYGLDGSDGMNAQGGGVWADGGKLDVISSTVTGNGAIGGDGGDGSDINPANGQVGNGGLGGEAQGGGIRTIFTTVTLTGSTISSNTATGGKGGDGGKGGHEDDELAHYFNGGGNGGQAGNAKGGGLYAEAGSVAADGTTVSANTAIAGKGGDGGVGEFGGLGTIGGAAFGGGVFAACPTVSFTKASHLLANAATGGAGGAGGSATDVVGAGDAFGPVGIGGQGGTGGFAEGGGLYSGEADATVTLSDGSAQANSATGGIGGRGGDGGQGGGGNAPGDLGEMLGSGGDGGQGGDARGGGLDTGGSTATFTNDDLADNAAKGGDGGLGGNGGSASLGGVSGGNGGAAGCAQGGALFTGDDATIPPVVASLTVNGGRIGGNTATGGNGGSAGIGGLSTDQLGGFGGQGGDGGEGEGGALYQFLTTSKLIGVFAAKNLATGGNGGIGANGAPGPDDFGGDGGDGGKGGGGKGGAIFADAGTVQLQGGTKLELNVATGGIGGNAGAGNVGDDAGGGAGAGGRGGDARGGGLCTSDAAVNVTAATVSGNSAVAGSGGFGDSGGEGTDGKGGDGGAGGDGGNAQGGGLWIAGGTFTLTTSTLDSNTTTGGNGGNGGVGQTGSDGGGAGGPGGAAGAAQGAGLFMKDVSATLTASTLSNNNGFGATGGLGGGGGLGTGDSNGGRGGDGGPGGAAQGGGLFVAGGNASLVNVTISSNVEDAASFSRGGNGGPGGLCENGDPDQGGFGGDGGSGGAVNGGGIYADLTADLTLHNVTLAGNSLGSGIGGTSGSIGGTGGAQGDGGPQHGAAGAGQTATGGGLFIAAGGTVDTFNTLIGLNTATVDPDLSGMVHKAVSNFVGILNLADLPPPGSDNKGNIFGIVGHAKDPLIKPLHNNGGPTQTRALISSGMTISPAINHGDDASIPTGVDTDQRGPGFKRKVGTVDIGAFEFQGKGDGGQGSGKKSSATQTGDVLVIQGTDANNQITIVDGGRRGVSVALDGAAAAVFRGVDRIVVEPGDGNDRVDYELVPSVQPADLLVDLGDRHGTFTLNGLIGLLRPGARPWHIDIRGADGLADLDFHGTGGISSPGSESAHGHTAHDTVFVLLSMDVLNRRQ
jgi:hypothetical protein